MHFISVPTLGGGNRRISHSRLCSAVQPVSGQPGLYLLFRYRLSFMLCESGFQVPESRQYRMQRQGSGSPTFQFPPSSVISTSVLQFFPSVASHLNKGLVFGIQLLSSKMFCFRSYKLTSRPRVQENILLYPSEYLELQVVLLRPCFKNFLLDSRKGVFLSFKGQRSFV